MKHFLLFWAFAFLFFSNTCAAQMRTHFWTTKQNTKQKIEVTIDGKTGYAYLEGSQNPLKPTGDITVKPKPTVNINALLDLIGNKAFVVEGSGRGPFILRPKNGQSVFALANQLFESDQTLWAYPEFFVELRAPQADPLFPVQYYLQNTGQSGGRAGMDVKASEAWQITTGVNKIKVALLDTGVQPHEDLTETTASGIVSRVLTGYDPYNPSNPGAPTYFSSYIGHGEATTGIIAASHNTLGGAGIAPCADIVPLQIYDSRSTTSGAARSIRWAWEVGHADVICLNFNLVGISLCGQPVSYADINQAIDSARVYGRNGRGCPVVAASGNWGCDVSYPANYPGVIAVGALDRDGKLTSYSNSGPETCLVAFGGYNDIATTDLMGSAGYNSGNYMLDFQGTSASCPQVTGAVALMLSANPDLNEGDVTKILQNTATDMGAPGFDNVFGFGRLNVEAAVRAALPTISGPAGVSDNGVSYFEVPKQPGLTITWQASPAGFFVNSQATGNYAAFQAVPYPSDLGQQCGKLTATITGPCGSVTLSKSILIYPGATDISGQVPISSCNPRTMSESRVAHNVSAYPNPADRSLFLELSQPSSLDTTPAEATEYRITLHDIYGKRHFSIITHNPTYNVEVADLPDGIYFLKTTLKNSTSTKQIVIKH